MSSRFYQSSNNSGVKRFSELRVNCGKEKKVFCLFFEKFKKLSGLGLIFLIIFLITISDNNDFNF